MWCWFDCPQFRMSLYLVIFNSFLCVGIEYIPSKHIKRRLTRFDQKRAFRCFLCAACLPASLLMHVPISQLHAQWHFSTRLNSQRFLQFHPTVKMVACVNFCFIIIRQNFFPAFFFLAESAKIIVIPRRQTFFSPEQTSRMHSKRPPMVV